MLMRQIFDPKLAQYAYLVGCPASGEALIIDPQRDVDRYLEAARREGLRLVASAETHIHADFLSGARELAAKHGVRPYLSAEGGEDWRYAWADDETYSAVLLRHGDAFQIGGVELQVVHTPGHTPEHLSFLVYDRGAGAAEPLALVSGDFLFVGDLGRPDLLETAAGEVGAREPAARDLYRSARGLRSLPEFLQVWPGHGAGSACGKALGAVPMSTCGYERRFNSALLQVREGEEAFVNSILAGQPEPPMYFARMKRLNKEGPPLLGGLPSPPRLDGAALAKAAGRAEAVVVDTRADRRAFMDGHLAGSLYAPHDKSFPTITGSYVLPEEEIFLVVAEERLEEAVRDLVRIGLDRIGGWAPPEVLGELSTLRSTPVIDLPTTVALQEAEGATVLDVRGAGEHAAGAIEGSRNLAHTRLRDGLEDLPREPDLLVHCASGARAASAASMLERAGFQVRYVDDHYARWAS